ncbi:SDR family NAD(P)-dependent oxidoreductase [Sphingobium sp. DC-2]|uniref:SDR family NAD(P)-dependent oxidoreductase n=1 Tax=Sphingobium sp. DC-2 TaxID=1303256 RepID=UPI0004C3C2CE|nr:SDR family NAD(P)-dependent oxidoreductase [Sphingobium sp. DC-2]
MPTDDSADLPTADDVLRGMDLSGRTAIVTGASSGVGIAIASALAGAGAKVTLAVRDMAAGERAAAGIAAERGLAQAPGVEAIDLLSMASVRDFAARWGDRPLDLLINNAGLMAPPLTRTADGFESQMAVNYFAPFLLSELLLPHLAARKGRVVILSSGSHHLAELRIDDLNYERRAYDRFEGYGHAKLCANLLAVEYSRRHAADGVTMNACTPGGVATNLGRHATFEDAVRLGWVNEDGTLPQGRMKTAEEGAATPVWAGTAPELEGKGGLYLEDCAIAPLWSPPMPPGWGVSAASLDPDAARRLWDVAEPLILERCA